MSKPRQRQRNIRAKADHVTGCVFLPAHTTSNKQGYMQFVRGLIGREACRVGRGVASYFRSKSSEPLSCHCPDWSSVCSLRAGRVSDQIRWLVVTSDLLTWVLERVRQDGVHLLLKPRSLTWFLSLTGLHGGFPSGGIYIGLPRPYWWPFSRQHPLVTCLDGSECYPIISSPLISPCLWKPRLTQLMVWRPPRPFWYCNAAGWSTPLTFVRFLTKICEQLLALLFSCHSCALPH